MLQGTGKTGARGKQVQLRDARGGNLGLVGPDSGQLIWTPGWALWREVTGLREEGQVDTGKVGQGVAPGARVERLERQDH